jgi:hypothetical protein
MLTKYFIRAINAFDIELNTLSPLILDPYFSLKEDIY